MAGSGGAGQVVNLIHFQPDRLGHIVPHEFEIRQLQQMRDVGFLAGEEVIQADDVVALSDEPFAEVRPEKTGSAGHEDSFDLRHVVRPNRASDCAEWLA